MVGRLLNPLLPAAEVALGLTSGAEPQGNAWTRHSHCGCDHRLGLGPGDLRVHIRPQAHSGAFKSPAATRPLCRLSRALPCGQAQEPSAVLVLHPAPGPGGLCWSSLLLLTCGTPWLVGPAANVTVQVSVVSGSLDRVSWAPATCCHGRGCSRE